MYKQEVETHEIPKNSKYVIIHDPITALYFLNKELFSIQNIPVLIDYKTGDIFATNESDISVNVAYLDTDKNDKLIENFFIGIMQK